MINIYCKNTEDISVFEPVIKQIRREHEDIEVTIESRRSFRIYEEIKKQLTDGDIVLVFSASSLGLNNADIAKELSWFIDTSHLLVVYDNPASYEFGVEQPMNKAVLMTMMKAYSTGNRDIVPINKRSNSGRKPVSFPDGWEELYQRWENKEISSGKFLEESGLKKATFYNLITEYRLNQQQQNDFKRKYDIS